MEAVLDLIRENAAWLFGSGGLAAFALALLRHFHKKPPPDAPAAVGPMEIVGGDKTVVTRQGYGPIEFAIAAALIVAITGGGLLLLGPEQGGISASNGSIVTQGDNNQTIIFEVE